MRQTGCIALVALAAFFIYDTASSHELDGGLVIDHTCTDLAEIPVGWIIISRTDIRLHYAHTSHGGQLYYGIEQIQNENPLFKFAYENNALPSVQDALCIFNGQLDETYITPELYWSSNQGMELTRQVLADSPPINTSMWAWCSQLNNYNESEVQGYLDSLSVLELEHPDTLFIYMTGNAQEDGGYGYNRYLRNEQIRAYCRANEKVLFDFADLDCWWYNPDNGQWEFSTYDYEGSAVPIEHPRFRGSEIAHTTYESCHQKGRALWWMVARITGWSGPVAVEKGSWGKLKGMYD